MESRENRPEGTERADAGTLDSRNVARFRLQGAAIGRYPDGSGDVELRAGRSSP